MRRCNWGPRSIKKFGDLVRQTQIGGNPKTHSERVKKYLYRNFFVENKCKINFIQFHEFNHESNRTKISAELILISRFL